MTATPVLNADLGNYSGRLGSAQRLSNGNYSFLSGAVGFPPPSQIGQTIEVLPDGTKSYVLKFASPEYRSYRLRTLYEGIDDALAGAPQKVESFLNDGLPFDDIPEVIRGVLDAHVPSEAASLETILKADGWARAEARSLLHNGSRRLTSRP